MIIKNKHTGKEYPISKERWDILGKSQKVFTIVNAVDNHTQAQQVTSNMAKEKAAPASTPQPEKPNNGEKQNKTQPKNQNNDAKH